MFPGYWLVLAGICLIGEGLERWLAARKLEREFKDGDPLNLLRFCDQQLDKLSDGRLPEAMETRIVLIVKEELKKKEPPKA